MNIISVNYYYFWAIDIIPVNYLRCSFEILNPLYRPQPLHPITHSELFKFPFFKLIECPFVCLCLVFHFSNAPRTTQGATKDQPRFPWVILEMACSVAA